MFLQSFLPPRMNSCSVIEGLEFNSTIEALLLTTHVSSMSWIYVFIDIFELIYIAFSTVVVSSGLYIFKKTPVFHQHLIRLFYCVATVYYFIIIFRIIPIVIHLFYGRPISTKLEMFSCIDWIAYIEYVRFGFMGCYACCLKCIVIERFFAIFHLATYEKHSYKWFTSVCILGQIIIGCSGFLLLYYKLLDLIVLVSGAGLLNISCCLFFFTAERINNHLYKNALKSNSYRLSERYQIIENIKTTYLLKRALLICFVLNLSLEICTITNAFVENLIVRQASLILFNYLIVTYSVIFVCVALLSNEIWKKQTIRHLHQFKQKLQGTSNKVNIKINTKEVPILRTVHGNQMNFNLDQECEIYFKSLETMWNQHFTTTRPV